jgi:ADP-ribosylglycohydrolase
LWALTTTENFTDGIYQSIIIGGDTDTYAAVAGSFLGARYGEDSILSAWKEKLLGDEVMLDIADRLYKRSRT